ncbi:MAG TPA: cupin domain-containing protein [Chloroflexota bacterium]|nr:cupin domain-containing protein [Chloroflexota bacterium]
MEGGFQFTVNTDVDREAKFQERPDLTLRNRLKAENPGLEAQKRIIRAADRKWTGNTQTLVDASNGFGDKAVACFLRRIKPGESSDIHRHNFEALGYVVKGRGYEIHDGERIDWAEGDALFIPANVWHQHFNSDPKEDAVLLLITNWPLLLHLGICTLEPAPTWEDALSRPSAIPDPVLKKVEAK